MHSLNLHAVCLMDLLLPDVVGATIDMIHQKSQMLPLLSKVNAWMWEARKEDTTGGQVAAVLL